MYCIVIFGACVDLIRPVDLFQHHHPGQMVGKGHGGHGQLGPRLGLEGGGKAVGAADQKGQAASPPAAPVGQEAGELLAGAHAPLNAQGDQADEKDSDKRNMCPFSHHGRAGNKRIPFLRGRFFSVVHDKPPL